MKEKSDVTVVRNNDSQGFKSGATEELDIAWKFIEERSTRADLKDQLHAIWYLALFVHR